MDSGQRGLRHGVAVHRKHGSLSPASSRCLLDGKLARAAHQSAEHAWLDGRFANSGVDFLAFVEPSIHVSVHAAMVASSILASHHQTTLGSLAAPSMDVVFDSLAFGSPAIV